MSVLGAVLNLERLFSSLDAMAQILNEVKRPTSQDNSLSGVCEVQSRKIPSTLGLSDLKGML